MSDKPSNDKPEIKGAWKQPERTGGWTIPQQETSDAQAGGWKVPAMPPELSATPAREGTWHLPRPEDTRFGPEDEVEIGDTTAPPRPEEIDEDETAEPRDAEDTDDLESYSGLGDLVASLTTLIEAQPKPQILPGADDDEDTTAPPRILEDDTDDFGFGDPSQAEREALEQALSSQSTEINAADYARQRVDWLSEDTDEDADTAAAPDPGAYARQQIEALQSGQDSQAAVPTEPVPDDPAAYARQQIAQLGGAGVSAAEPQAPVEDELTRKFRETERQVRALRQQYRSGLITREQLQEQLRKYLVLDNNDQWWMMGVDSDIWYRYDNVARDWVIDTPPITPAGRVPTATSDFTPDEVLKGQLPYLPDDAEVTDDDTAATDGTEPFLLDPDMPLPRRVPVTDPDATIPGNIAINQDTMRMSDAMTLDSGYGAAPTMRAAPVETTPYQPETMFDQTALAQPPSYEDFDSESQAYAQAVERQRQSTLRRILLIASLFIGGAFIVGTLLVLFVVVSYNNIAASYREQINQLQNYQPDFQSVRVLDASGNQIAELNSEQGGSRESIGLAQMSPEVIYAIVGSQDPNFYETSGFDTITIAGAFVQSLGGGAPRVSPTRATITQHVADLVIASSPNAGSATRLDEVVVAAEISRQYDKNFILELYLNEQFFGNQSYGVQAASEFYFNKPAREVNLVEGSLLASLLRDPIDNDPVPKENRDRAFVAADNVLRELASVGCLNFQHAQYRTGAPYCIQNTQVLRPNGDFTANINLQRAQMQTLPLLPRSLEGRYPHFVDFVRRELIREYGNEIFRGGYEVRTTLVPELQDLAQRALRDQIRAQGFTGIQTGAVMAVRPETGEILAMVGSPDFNDTTIDGQTNYALTWRLPGATILPIVYTRALEGVGDRNANGRIDFSEYLTAATILFDLPRDFQDPNYVTTNADGQYRGAVSLRQALANSLRVPAVKVFNYVGSEGFVDIARKMGLTFLTEPPVVDHRTSVGDVTEVRLWDMMKAYGTLANTGRFVPLRTITEIRNSDGQVVPLTDALTPRAPAQVVSPQVSFLVQNILSDAQFYESGFAPLFLPNYPGRTAAKINHLDNNRDMWAIGFSRNVVVGVWMGRTDTAATIANSRDAALPVWTTVMGGALSGTNPLPFNSAPANLVPTGSVQNLVICAPTGTQPGPNCPQQRNEFFAITNPPPPADQGAVVTLPVDSWTRLIANEFCRDNVIQDQFVQLVPGDPYAINWLNTAAGRPTANRMGLPQNVQSVPTAACELNTDLPTALISSPAPGTVLTGNISILGAATASTFDSYQIEYAPAGSVTYTIIAGPVRTPQPNQNGVLAEWNTSSVGNGLYNLRLTMNSRTGGFVRREVQVTVMNPTPTPMPTATPMPIPPTDIPFFPTTTTIPIFPTPISPIEVQPLGIVTPTATLVFGG
jgi:membrane peptidoglycan carboxypeptidase